MTIKVLLFGNYDALSRSIIARFEKESHQVFVITGNKRKMERTPKQVFQEYNFEYYNDSVEQIVKTVQPDVIIYKAMFDQYKKWSDDSLAIANAMRGLTNVITDAHRRGVGHFIYLSSLEIFKDNKDVKINENTLPITTLPEHRFLTAGEDLCRNYYGQYSTDLSIVRLAHVYGVHQDFVYPDTGFETWLKAGIKSEKLLARGNVFFPLVFIDDAVDYLNQLLVHPDQDHVIYHIAPANGIGASELELANIAKAAIEYPLSLDVVMDDNVEHVLQFSESDFASPKLYQKHQVEQGFTRMVNVLKKSIYGLIKEEEKEEPLIEKIKKKRGHLIQLLENILFFLVVQSLIILTQNLAFHEVLNVYLLYVLVIAAVYGYLQGIFAVIFSLLGRLYMHVYQGSPVLQFDGDEVYLWVLQLFVVGALVGYLKDKYKRRDMDHQDERAYLITEVDNLRDIHDANLEIKAIYENRLLNYKDSFARIYDLVARFDVIEPEHVIFKAIKAVSDIVKSEDVAIYNYDNQSDYCRLIAATSQKAKSFGKTIQLKSHEALYTKLSLAEIYVNTDLDPDMPMMVGGAYAEGRLQSLIVVWTLPFDSNNLYERNNFGILCTLVGNSFSRATQYMDNINTAYNYTDEGLLKPEAFKAMVDLYAYGVAEGVVEFTIAHVLENTEIDRPTLVNELKRQVRDTDYIGVTEDQGLLVLLTNTTEKEAAFVVNRLKEKQIYLRIGDES